MSHVLHSLQSHNHHTSSIQPLTPPTIDAIRSSTVIPSLPQALLELIQNSLDAHSTHIVIHLDLEGWGIRVEDDGEGMSPDTLRTIGRGQRYGTSKSSAGACLALHSMFGFRGEALPSLATLAMLEIVSTTASSASYSCIVKGGTTMHLGPSKRYRRTKPGTTVILKDLFFNLPVRRTSSSSRSSLMRACKRVCDSASMLFPSVAITIYERERVEQARANNTGDGIDGGKVWSVGKTGGGVVARFSQLHGMALVQSFTSIAVEREDMKLDGFISTQGASSKNYQYLYVNRHPLSRCELHKAIEDRFERSSFARDTTVEVDESSYQRTAPRRLYRKPVFVLNLTVSPARLDLNLEPSKAVVQFEDWRAVTRFLIAATDDFLRQHGLLIAFDQPRVSMDLVDPPPSSQRPPVTLATKSALNTLSSNWKAVKPRIKNPNSDKESGSQPAKRKATEQALEYDLDLPKDAPLTRWIDPKTKHQFLIDRRTGSSFFPRTDASEERPHQQRRTLKPSQEEGAAAGWLKAAIEEFQSPLFPTRTEPSIPVGPAFDPALYRRPSIRAEAHSPWNLQSSESPISSQKLTRAALQTVQYIAQVDRKFLACRVTLLEEDAHDIGPGPHGTGLRQQEGPLTSRFFSKEHVSRTFARSNTGKPQKECLVLVDQHAADERVRLEGLIQVLGSGFLAWTPPSEGNDSTGIPTTPTPNMLILLPSPEYHHLQASSRTLLALSRWGIKLRLPRRQHVSRSSSCVEAWDGPPLSQVETAFHQLHVDAVPTMLYDRLVQPMVGVKKDRASRPRHSRSTGGGRGTSSTVLEEIVLEFLGRVMTHEEEGLVEAILRVNQHAIRLQEEKEGKGVDDRHWWSVMRFCPRGMLGVVDSLACRGAIMFGDPLTRPQAERLLSRLAETTFPFQCAHGRPSMMPITMLGPLPGTHAGTVRSLQSQLASTDRSRVGGLTTRGMSTSRPQSRVAEGRVLDWETFGLDG